MYMYFIHHASNLLPDNATTEILRRSRSLQYHQSLPFYQPTPLVALPALASQLGIGNILLKDESFRFGLNAFKGLGASYAIHMALQQQPTAETFCTATDGNHGRAVAWSARLTGKKAVVYVPHNTTLQRIRAIEAEGAAVIQIAGHYDAACAAAAAAVQQHENWLLVQDTAWEGYEIIPAHIMAGYLTHFVELENTVHSLPQPAVDVVLLQAGWAVGQRRQCGTTIPGTTPNVPGW